MFQSPSTAPVQGLTLTIPSQQTSMALNERMETDVNMIQSAGGDRGVSSKKLQQHLERQVDILTIN